VALGLSVPFSLVTFVSISVFVYFQCKPNTESHKDGMSDISKTNDVLPSRKELNCIDDVRYITHQNSISTGQMKPAASSSSSLSNLSTDTPSITINHRRYFECSPNLKSIPSYRPPSDCLNYDDWQFSPQPILLHPPPFPSSNCEEHDNYRLSSLQDSIPYHRPPSPPPSPSTKCEDWELSPQVDSIPLNLPPSPEMSNIRTGINRHVGAMSIVAIRSSVADDNFLSLSLSPSIASHLSSLEGYNVNDTTYDNNLTSNNYETIA